MTSSVLEPPDDRNAFAVPCLPEWPDLEDETVRAAWRAIAADTHPDRADGGDLARYSQACAAFAELNSPWSRSEAYANLVEQAWAEGRFDDYPDGLPDGCRAAAYRFGSGRRGARAGPAAKGAAHAGRDPSRIRRGYPWRLLVRDAVVAGLCLAVLALFPAVPPLAAAAVASMLFVVYGRVDNGTPPSSVRRKNRKGKNRAGKGTGQERE